MAPCFVLASPGSTIAGRARPAAVFCSRPARKYVTPARRIVRMGLGEDGLDEDLKAARECVEGGCAVDAVQDILTRLEQRRGVLALELTQINDVMSTLAKENLGGDRNLIAQAMEAAVRIFSKVEDNFPATGDPMSYTGEKPKRKQSKM